MSPSVFVQLVCPKCGNRAAVRANAYNGGWCIGSGATKHKPANWKVVTDE